MMKSACASLTALLLLVQATAASAQTWNYQATKKGRGGEQVVDGTLTLSDAGDGKGSITIYGPGGACYGRPQPVLVTRDADVLTLEMTEALRGCDVSRFVLRNDGSGGYKEVKRDDGSWGRSKSEHGLTLKR